MATWQHLRSSTANKRPTTSLADGRIAINTNTASPGLFFKDSAGTGIVKVGPVHVGTTAPNSVPASGGSSGNYTGEQWLDTSVSPAQMKVWNGSTWVGIVADELPVSKLQDGAPRQLIQTDAAGTGVEWTSNVDVPGTLDVTSTATFDSIASHPLGTAGAPTITFTGDTNTGIYSPGADQVAISSNGVGRLFIDASGNVGVGSASSGSLLDLAVLPGSTSQDGVKLSSSGQTGFFAFTGNSYTYRGVPASSEMLYSSTNMAFLVDAAANITWHNNGGERMRLDSSGRLGLGTSSVSQKLQIAAGNVQIDSGYGFIWDNSTTGIYGSGSPSFLQFYTGNAERMRVTSTGVGIGTNAASERLHVVGGNSRFEGNYVSFNNNGYIRTDATNELRLQAGSSGTIFANSGNSEIGRWDSSGRFLVGTSTARENLLNSTSSPRVQIEGTNTDGSSLALITSFASATAGASPIINFCRAGSTALGSNTVVASGNYLGQLIFSGNDGSEFVSAASIHCQVDGTPGANDMPGRLVFSTTADGASSPTERMRISSQGVVQVSNGRLYVQVSEASNPLCYAYNTNNAASDITYRSELGAGSNGTSAYHFYGVTGGSGKFAIYGNGTYGTISDQNLKTHIQPARDGYLADINQIKIVKYGWKSDELSHATELGVVAQEVEQVFPGLVQECPPNEDGEVFKGVKTSVFTFMLIKALQEASSKIESLESRIAALEAS